MKRKLYWLATLMLLLALVAFCSVTTSAEQFNDNGFTATCNGTFDLDFWIGGGETSYKIYVPYGSSATATVTASCNEGELTYVWEDMAGDDGAYDVTGPSLTFENITWHKCPACTVCDAYGNEARFVFHIMPDDFDQYEASADIYVNDTLVKTVSADDTIPVSIGDRLSVVIHTNAEHYTPAASFYVDGSSAYSVDEANNTCSVDAISQSVYIDCFAGIDKLDSFATLSFEINNDFNAEASVPTVQQVSPGETVTLAVQASANDNDLTYQWEDRSDIGDDQQGLSSVTFTPSASGAYTCTVLDSFGSSRKIDFLVLVGQARSISLGQTQTIDASNNDVFYFKFTPSVSGTYVMTTAEDDCLMRLYLYQDAKEIVRDQFGPFWFPVNLAAELTADTEYTYLLYCDEAHTVTLNLSRKMDNIFSGTCGDNLTWTLDKDGVLTISGSGTMADYEYGETPWFNYQNSITSVNIGSGVTSISDNAFQECFGLTSATIGNDVARIGSCAFYSCRDLNSITLPDSVTSIGDWAFYGCSSLNSITIPASVASIEERAFGMCDNLTAIHVAGSNPSYTSVSGVLFNKGQTTLIVCPGGYWGAFAIPDSVTSIDSFAFYYCHGLSSVTIPDSVASIGSLNFYHCSSLTSIDVNSGNLSYSSSGGVLLNKNQTTLIACPGGFSGTYTIPFTVTSIGDNAFAGCSNLTGLTIPDSVTSIGDWAFRECYNLISVAIPVSVTSIGDGTFYECSSLIHVYYPGTREQWDEVIIGSHNEYLTDADIHFGGDGIVASGESGDQFALITGEEPVGTEFYIDIWNFWGMQGMLDANGNGCPKFVSILDDTLYRDQSVQNDDDPEAWISGRYIWESYLAPGAPYESYAAQYVYVKTDSEDKWQWTLSWDGVLTISGTGEIQETPWNAKAVISVVIEDGITGIGINTFSECSYLSSVSLSKSVTAIGNNALPHGASLMAVNVDSGNTAYSSEGGVLYNADKTELIFCPCGKTGVISIPSSVTSISQSAFSSCTGLTGVILPESLVSIGRNAFYSCSGLTGIQIPASVTSIGNGAFANCQYLESIAVAEANPAFRIENGLLCNKNLTVVYCCPGAKTGPVVLPDSVKTIQACAFQCCRNITSLVLPEGVTHIGEVAFNACGSLQSVTLPASLEEIEWAAFYTCRSLTNVYYAGSQTQWESITIGAENEPLTSAAIHYNYQPSEIVARGTCGYDLIWTLYEDGSMTITGTGDMYDYSGSNGAPWKDASADIHTVVVESGVTGIGNQAFYFCRNLTSVSLPESLLRIGSGAFERCIALQEITLPGSLTSIGEFAFMDSGLQQISIPAGTATKDWLFYEMNYPAGGDVLRRITVPAGIADLDVSCFFNTYLPAISPDFTTPTGLTTIGSEAFSGVSASFVWLTDDVNSIGSQAFSNCTNLRYVRIPSNCSSIAEDAFPAGTTLLVDRWSNSWEPVQQTGNPVIELVEGFNG